MVNILKTTELYTLDGWILWNVNYIAIKLIYKIAEVKPEKNNNINKKFHLTIKCMPFNPYVDRFLEVLYLKIQTIKPWNEIF